ncbi:hypothetical protein EJ02DRAFT_460810 [Clathrospora elynae]|uniref:F-box domain-containing protein n=1 Tax=Clathrospora elynae TaxID=706981 RepID=A0A6A5S2K8_9PLEO|nr:hypothetical protein EJ02DRAFT_460810 [Clathrospora elynae]
MEKAASILANLDTLPDELILGILDYISIEDYASLRALNATNWHLHRLTVDRLYSRFPGRAPEQFLRAVVLPPSDERTTLANHVNEVVWWTHDHWTRQARGRCLSLGDRHLLANKLRSSGCILNVTDPSLDLPRRFIGFSAEYEVHWWYLEFFLFFTPKVQKLVVHDVWHWDDHTYWFENLAANPERFENLKSITLCGPLRLENVVPLLTLPSIRNMELTQVISMRQEPGREFSWTNDRDRYLERRLPAGGSSLEHLTLRDSHIYFKKLGGELSALRNLKSFTYDHLKNELGPSELSTYAFPVLGSLLPREGSSLEYLRIRDDCLANVSQSDLIDTLTTRCFGGNVSADVKNLAFGKIHTLDIGPCNFGFLHTSDSTILGAVRHFAQCLPTTLETLRMQWQYQYINVWEDRMYRLQVFIDFLRLLAPAAVSACPNLKEVALVDWPALVGWFPLPAEVTELQRTYEEVGITFKVIYEEIQGAEPLEVLIDVEPGWLWVQETEAFERNVCY